MKKSQELCPKKSGVTQEKSRVMQNKSNNYARKNQPGNMYPAANSYYD